MFDNEIIPPGKKLKKYRKMLGATQDEIAKRICTKNNISQVENGKQKLSYNLACEIAKKLNEIAQNKGTDIKLITANDLTKDEDSQANDIFNNSIMNKLKEIKEINFFEQMLCEAENLIEKYNIEDARKIELYKLAADFYYSEHRYARSDTMCRKGLKIDNIIEEVNFYIYKSRNSIVTERYNEALEQLDCAENLNNRICSDNFSVSIFLNRALIYKKQCMYDQALTYLQILKDKFEIKQTMLLKVKMLYANCLNDQDKFEQAKKEYIEILDTATDSANEDYIALAYRNLSELHLNKGKYKDAAKYIKDSLVNNPSNQYFGENLYFAAKVLPHVNEDVEMYLLQALDICETKDKENLSLIEKIIYELVLFYMKREDEENIMLMTRKVEELNIDFRLIYSELVKHYRGRNEEKNMYFNDKLIEKMKQIKKI